MDNTGNSFEHYNQSCFINQVVFKSQIESVDTMADRISINTRAR